MVVIIDDLFLFHYNNNNNKKRERELGTVFGKAGQRLTTTHNQWLKKQNKPAAVGRP